MPEDRTMPTPSTDPVDRLAALVGAGADRLGIEADARLLLAVSGGADSIALLHGCARLVATRLRAWHLSVAHLDHALRADSADDAAFVVAAATTLGVASEVRRTDVAALARDGGRSIEEAGRDARYRFLEEVAPAGALIATAHTLDDTAETVLINLLRGSGLGGAAGIPPRRGRIVRPLLDALAARRRIADRQPKDPSPERRGRWAPPVEDVGGLGALRQLGRGELVQQRVVTRGQPAEAPDALHGAGADRFQHWQQLGSNAVAQERLVGVQRVDPIPDLSRVESLRRTTLLRP